MAFVNRLDPREAEHSLTVWLAAQLPDVRNVTITDVEIPSANGRSSETMMFSAAWTDETGAVRQDLVARVLPAGEVLFPQYDIVAEYQVMKTLREFTEVPVPAVRWVETDSSVLGTPFLVMDRASGQAPPDVPPFPMGSWVVDLPVDAQSRLYDNGLQQLATIHLADPEKLGLRVLESAERGFNGLDQLIPFFENFFEAAADGEPNPTIEAAFDWVRDNRPADETPRVVTWGDARLGNILFDADQGVTAVLDWELAGLGSPELDLGWWVFFDRHHTEGVGAPPLPGFPNRAAVVRRYEELTGRKVRDLHFYEVFAGLRSSVMMVRIAQMMTRSGMLPPGSGMAQSNPALALLAALLGLPAPEGPVVSAL